MPQHHSNRWKHRWALLKRLLAGFYFRLWGRTNASRQPISFFSIKPGYHHALNALPFDDRANTDEWQKEVYQLAASLAADMNYPGIIDIGCGSGYKLVNMLGEYDTTGIEINPAYQWLVEKYPTRKWLLFDETDPAALHADLVICADVIEHLENPDDLLDFIDAMHFHWLVISTPERDAIAGKNDYGPPENPSHYREWNAIEFKNYLRKRFRVAEQRIFNDKSVTQVVICQKTEPS